MNSDSDSNNPTCLDFHELESTFGESKSNIGTLRKNIIEVLMRFNRDILEDSISGFISEINTDKDTGKLHSEVESPITFRCHYRLKQYLAITDSDSLTMYLWYNQGLLHRNGDSPAVILCGNNNTLYQEIWTDGLYKTTKIRVPEIKSGVPHPRRPIRN
jgi:hypothetical protein